MTIKPFRSLLSQYLRESNFEVFSAPNGPAGLRLAFNEHPDLVLLDVMMPGMDGWEVCTPLTRAERCSGHHDYRQDR